SRLCQLSREIPFIPHNAASRPQPKFPRHRRAAAGSSDVSVAPRSGSRHHHGPSTATPITRPYASASPSRPPPCRPNEAAIRNFVAKHAAATTGTLSCFDRLLSTGHLSLGYPHGMEDFLNHQGVLFKQLKPFVLRQADRLRAHSHAVEEKAGRPWQYFESPVRRTSAPARSPAATASPRASCASSRRSNRAAAFASPMYRGCGPAPIGSGRRWSSQPRRRCGGPLRAGVRGLPRRKGAKV